MLRLKWLRNYSGFMKKMTPSMIVEDVVEKFLNTSN